MGTSPDVRSTGFTRSLGNQESSSQQRAWERDFRIEDCAHSCGGWGGVHRLLGVTGCLVSSVRLLGHGEAVQRGPVLSRWSQFGWKTDANTHENQCVKCHLCSKYRRSHWEHPGPVPWSSRRSWVLMDDLKFLWTLQTERGVCGKAYGKESFPEVSGRFFFFNLEISIIYIAVSKLPGQACPATSPGTCVSPLPWAPRHSHHRHMRIGESCVGESCAVLLPVTSSAEKGDERQGDDRLRGEVNLSNLSSSPCGLASSDSGSSELHSPHEYILSAFCLRDLGHVSGQNKDPGPQGAYILLGAVKPLSSLRQGWWPSPVCPQPGTWCSVKAGITCHLGVPEVKVGKTPGI